MTLLCCVVLTDRQQSDHVTDQRRNSLRKRVTSSSSTEPGATHCSRECGVTWFGQQIALLCLFTKLLLWLAIVQWRLPARLVTTAVDAGSQRLDLFPRTLMNGSHCSRTPTPTANLPVGPTGPPTCRRRGTTSKRCSRPSSPRRRSKSLPHHHGQSIDPAMEP